MTFNLYSIYDLKKQEPVYQISASSYVKKTLGTALILVPFLLPRWLYLFVVANGKVQTTLISTA